MNRSPALIVHVLYRFGVGGLENGVVNLVNRLPRQSWRHAVIALSGIDNAFAARLTRHDTELVSLNKGPGHAARLYPSLYRMFSSMRPAIVHSRNLAALETTVPAWAARVPVRIHGEHGRDEHDPEGRNVKRRWIRRLFRPFVDHYIAVSPDLERYLVDRIGVSARDVDQIYNGVDTTHFRPVPSRVPIDGAPFADPRHFILGTVGRLDPVKAQTQLAQAFARAVSEAPAERAHWRLVVVGTGPLRSQIESILAAARLLDRVWLAGERHDIARLMRGLDAFVLPSLAEGVSNTILEAMASGLPVVATRVGANAELVGTAGTIVPASDMQALIGALVKYDIDRGRAHLDGRAARARVEEHFSLDRMVDRYDRLYRRLVADRAGGGRWARRAGARDVATH